MATFPIPIVEWPINDFVSLVGCIEGKFEDFLETWWGAHEFMYQEGGDFDSTTFDEYTLLDQCNHINIPPLITIPLPITHINMLPPNLSFQASLPHLLHHHYSWHLIHRITVIHHLSTTPTAITGSFSTHFNTITNLTFTYLTILLHQDNGHRIQCYYC